ncbi:hypothetical protein PAXRUDRAFT_836234, partial [Paxillus rubicundulus Ve08.2h10]
QNEGGRAAHQCLPTRAKEGDSRLLLKVCSLLTLILLSLKQCRPIYFCRHRFCRIDADTSVSPPEGSV